MTLAGWRTAKRQFLLRRPAAGMARQWGMLTVGFTCQTGGELKKLADLRLCVPSDVAARIQEFHILTGHIISGHCERALTEKR